MSAPSCLLDTSALARFLAEDDAQNALLRATIGRLASEGTSMCFTPQVSRECWAVLSRPRDVGGFGFSFEDTANLIHGAHAGLTFIPDTPDVYSKWLEIVMQYQVLGRQVHDAYHVAAMISHGITRVLTLDDRDFRRYSNISVIHPSDVSA